MFKIRWMPEAEQEYYSTLEYWIEHNKSTEYSLKIMQEVERFEEILISNPHLGKTTNTELSVLKITMLNQFYIYYKVTQRTINIIAFKSTHEDHHKHGLGI
ncbi:hypothetical protein SDC9_175218 [bioreactor metagenome]|uniref:Type II toxin-antitoxin system RelE/ParE family toxin n=2 Tax=root TaxID=1 RepID=A0A0J7J0I7_9FLAO|nr:type II toxin-antitoxin system RelE/ParE family toxin [Chryseobacterium koreense]KMQ71787.1 hypothetical protein ACM44_06140 [Chryseobacterium koreense CCUG 49689]MBB5334274.1 plasmid stabilization system protein ParE [Chryseobacterium koreense]